MIRVGNSVWTPVVGGIIRHHRQQPHFRTIYAVLFFKRAPSIHSVKHRFSSFASSSPAFLFVLSTASSSSLSFYQLRRSLPSSTSNMMLHSLVRSGVGILGSGVSLLMYAAPIATMKTMIEKKSTDKFSGFPYAIALFNCLIYMLYGSPLISNKWENVVVLVVNAIGFLLECCFISIYLTFASPKVKKTMLRMLACVIILFGATTTVAFLALHNRKEQKLVVGTTGMVATVILYGSPLSVIKLVIETRSVEYMPFHLSLCSFVCSILWLIYGILGKDLIIMAPNLMGLALGIAQMLLYGIYRSKKREVVEDNVPNATAQMSTAMNAAAAEEEDNNNINEHDIEMQQGNA